MKCVHARLRLRMPGEVHDVLLDDVLVIHKRSAVPGMARIGRGLDRLMNAIVEPAPTVSHAPYRY